MFNCGAYQLYFHLFTKRYFNLMSPSFDFFCCLGVVVSLPMHVSESGDEGLGSMSPEPMSVITVTTEGHSVNSEVVELRRQLERERHARLHLEKQMRAIQSQLYPERFRDNQLIAYQPHEVTVLFRIIVFINLSKRFFSEKNLTIYYIKIN